MRYYNHTGHEIELRYADYRGRWESSLVMGFDPTIWYESYQGHQQAHVFIRPNNGDDLRLLRQDAHKLLAMDPDHPGLKYLAGCLDGLV